MHVETADAQRLMPRRTERLICFTIQLAVQTIAADQSADEPPDDAANNASNEATVKAALACFTEFRRRTNISHVPLPFVFSGVAFIHVSSLGPQGPAAIAITR